MVIVKFSINIIVFLTYKYTVDIVLGAQFTYPIKISETQLTYLYNFFRR